MYNKFTLPSLLVFFIIVLSLIGRIEFLQTVEFIVVQILVILLPGKLIADKICSQSKSTIHNFFESYFYGYALSLILYILLLAIGLEKYVIIPTIVSSIISLYFYLKHDFKKKYDIEKGDLIASCLFLCASFFLCTTAYTGNNLSPSIIGNTSPFIDYLYWLRNSAACCEGYPVCDLSIAGFQLNYHYLSSMHIAFLHTITNIELFDLCFVFTSVIIPVLIVGGSYIFVCEMGCNSILRYFAVAAILFTSGLETFTHLYYSSHIYVGSFGFSEGLGFALFSITLFIRFVKCEVNSILLLAYFVMFSLTVGLKSPLSLVLLGGVGVSCLYMFFYDEKRKKSVLIGFTTLISFVLAFYLFIMPHDSSDTSNRMPLISLTTTILKAPVAQDIYDLVFSFSNSFILSYSLVFFFYLASIAVIIFTMFLLLRLKRHRIVLNEISVLLFAIGIIGFMLTTFFKHGGSSQMYYWFISYPCLIVLLTSELEKTDIHSNIKYIIALSIAFLVGFTGMCTSLLVPSFIGVRNIIADTSEYEIHDGRSINAKEMEALRWLRNNSSADAIVVSNKVLSNGGSRSFIVSAFSERQNFIEGYDYSLITESEKQYRLNLVKKAFVGDYDAIFELKENGVDYIIAFKRLDNYLSNGNNQSIGIVFENSDVKIVKL